MTLKKLNSQIISCRKCNRLVKWREKVAKEKTKRYRNLNYWGKPVPGFGDPKAKLLIVGLAPAAHGGNRTGRMFTGDKSGEWLYKALYRFEFSNQKFSLSRNDGLKLKNCYITAACRCAPPNNKPNLIELKNCRSYLIKELSLLKNITVICALGKIGFDTIVKCFKELNWLTCTSRIKFGHGVEYQLNKNITLIGSYHPSQQNTFTKKLTEPMFNSIFKRIRELLKQR